MDNRVKMYSTEVYSYYVLHYETYHVVVLAKASINKNEVIYLRMVL